MRINIVTIFPTFFEQPLGLSIPARAAEAGLVEYRVVDLRDYTHDRHKTVDDIPYGGGAGMVMKPEPLAEAIRASTALPLAAVLVVPRLPTDIRHNSKIERVRLAEWADRILAGGRLGSP